MKGNHDLTPDDFSSRSTKMKTKQIPTTTEKKIIVKANNLGMGFRFDCYPNYILNGLISKEMFDITVRKANSICEHAWRESKIQETIDFFPKANYLYLISTILTIVGLILLALYMFADLDKISILVAAFILIYISCFFMIAVAILAFNTPPKFSSLENIVKARLDQFLDEENEKIYKKLHFRWVVEKEFYWLELINLKLV